MRSIARADAHRGGPVASAVTVTDFHLAIAVQGYLEVHGRVAVVHLGLPTECSITLAVCGEVNVLTRLRCAVGEQVRPFLPTPRPA